MIIIYHANCTDGFTSAWLANEFIVKWNDNCSLVSAQYGDDPPDVTDKDVYIVDFSYPKDVLLDMKEKAKSLIVMDHHNTVPQDVKDLDFVIFNNDRCGAGIVWDYINDKGMNLNWFHTGVREFVEYVEDRDLWRWELADSKEISAAISVQPMTLRDWTDIIERFDDQRADVINMGSAVLSYQKKVTKVLAKSAITREVAGFVVPTVNTGMLISEVGNYLVKNGDIPFAAMWYLRVDKNGNDVIEWSLRSDDDHEDVGAIAKSLGGGGHRNAAGFTSEIPKESGICLNMGPPVPKN